MQNNMFLNAFVFCSVCAVALAQQKVRKPIKQALSTPRLNPPPLNPKQMANRNQIPLQQQIMDDQQQAYQISGGFQGVDFRPPSDLNNLVPIAGPFANNPNINNMNTFPSQSFGNAGLMNSFNPVQLAQLNQLPIQQQLLQQAQAAQSQQAARQYGAGGGGYNGMMGMDGMQGNDGFNNLGPMAGVYGGQLANGGLNSIGLGGMYGGMYGNNPTERGALYGNNPGNAYGSNQGGSYNTAGNEAICTCTLQYAPLCGSDGRTYPNKCYFDCANRQNPALKVIKESECNGMLSKGGSENDVSIEVYEGPTFIPSDPCSWKCYGGSKPTCGSNGMTYGNECKFWRAVCRGRREGMAVTLGECPVDGSGGVVIKAPIVNLFKDFPPIAPAPHPTFATSAAPATSTASPLTGMFSAGNEISLRKLDPPDSFFNKEINLKL